MKTLYPLQKIVTRVRGGGSKLMVKLIVYIPHFQQLLKSGLPFKRQISCPIRFMPLNAQINFVFPSQEVAVFAKFSSPYFVDFEGSDEYFVVHQKIIENLKYCFLNDYNVRFWTDLEYAHIEGEDSGHTYQFRLIPVKENMKKSPFQLIMTETGLMPLLKGKVLAFNVQAWIAVEELVKNIPRSTQNKACLIWDGETLKLITCARAGSSMFEKTLNPKKYFFRGEPIATFFDWNTFRDLAKQFVGEVWLSIAKNGVLISRHEYSYSITYLQVAERVDDEL